MTDNKFLAGHVALVTGASKGIGRAIAVALAKEGAHVGLMGRDQKQLDETAKQCKDFGVDALTVSFDLGGDLSALRSIVGRVVEGLGGLSILVNNAGVFAGGVVGDVSLDQWDKALNTNLRSVMHLTRWALPAIAKSKDGAIINISSIAGKLTSGNAAAYCASKHGVVGFSGALFEDVRDRNIKVCCICPGFVNTPMVNHIRNLDPSKMIQVEDVAKTVLFVLSFPNTGCPTEIILRPQLNPVIS